MTLKMPLTMNSYHFQNHSLGKGKGTWVTEVAGPFVSYYTPWPREGHRGVLLVIRTVISGHILWWGSPLDIKPKRLLGQQIYPVDIQVPLALLYYPIQHGQWPFCPLVWSSGQWLGSRFSYPHPRSCEEECSIPSLIHPLTLPIECLP